MIVFELSHTDNQSLLRMLAGVMHLPYTGEDFLTIKPPVGVGMIKVINLAEELQVLLADVEFYQYYLARRQKSDQRYYVLHFEDVLIKGVAAFTVDGETLEKTDQHHRVVRLTSNVFTNTEEISAHARAKVVKVFFSEKWLKKYMGLEENVDGLQQYISLKTASFDIEPLDDEYLSLMNELWNVRKDDPLQNMFLQNRVTLLIERFFSRLEVKMHAPHTTVLMPEKDIEQLMLIERTLVKDLSVAPPAIDELAKMAAMSATKLKKSFKELYGSGMYTYYQQVRLQKAKEMLLSGRYSIKDTATAIGFNSTAHFSRAFKKLFHQLPSHFITK